MEYNYNNTMTISTSGPKNEMNARWALQNTLEGKALVYNECIKPLVGNRPLCEGVTLRLGDKPEQEADTEVFLVPGINDDGEAVLLIRYRSCDEEMPLCENESLDEEPERSRVPAYTRIVKGYIEQMGQEELEAIGLDEDSGRDHLLAALDTIDRLSTYNDEEAWDSYCDFMGGTFREYGFAHMKIWIWRRWMIRISWSGFMNPTIWKMSGPFDPKIKAALPDCDRQSGDRSGIMLSRQFPTSILTDTGIFIKK